MKHSAIIFDVFGTLIRKVPRRVSAHARLAALVESSRLPNRQDFMTRNVPISTFAAELGLEYLVPQLQRDIQEEIQQFKLFDDVLPTLRQLRGLGLKLAVCSNLSQDYGGAVRGLLPTMDAYALSYEVGAAKPSPVIYQAACDALSCRPRNALFIGDSKRADVEGPSAFGMDARLLDREADSLAILIPRALRR